jgi:hypothetical protein
MSGYEANITKSKYMGLHFLPVTENHKVFLLIVATNAGAVSFVQTFVLQSYSNLDRFCHRVE